MRVPRPTKLDPRQLLSGVPLFSQLPARDLDEVIALTSTRLFEAREEVFREGAPGDAAYAIFYGSLKAAAHGPDGRELLLSVMGPGEMFGELIGATRESVNKHLKALTERGVIARRGKQILVAPDRLRSLLEEGDD